MFLYSIVCSVLRSPLPGPGTIQCEQELMFPSATFAGDEVTVRVKVTAVQTDSGLADLTTKIIHPDGNLGLQGRTRVWLPDAPLVASLTPQSSQPASPSASFKGLEVGQQAQIKRSFSALDLEEYAGLVGDTNPIFVDAGYAQQRGLEAPIIPGSLLGGLFSCLLGTQLPGQGTNYLKQRLEFPKPAYVGQELTATVEIVRIRPEKQLVNLSTLCANPAGELVCRGEALVLVSDVERR